jgi:hypothetical protein
VVFWSFELRVLEAGSEREAYIGKMSEARQLASLVNLSLRDAVQITYAF